MPTKNSSPSFDDSNLAYEQKIAAQKTSAARSQATFAGVKSALDLREASRAREYEDARQDAQTAAANLSAAKLAAQTLLGGIKKANDGLAQSKVIRESLTHLVRQAYRAAEAIAAAVKAIDTFAGDVDLRLGKSELVSPRIVAGAADAKTEAQTALASILLALQSCVRAYAAACLADNLGHRPSENAQALLTILLPALGEDASGKVTNVASLSLSPPDTTSCRMIVQNMQQHGAKPGLLGLLDGVRKVTKEREIIAAEAKTVVELELGSTEQQLASATQDLNLLEAALSAAGAAID